jgi:hypothetical protein
VGRGSQPNDHMITHWEGWGGGGGCTWIPFMYFIKDTYSYFKVLNGQSEF